MHFLDGGVEVVDRLRKWPKLRYVLRWWCINTGRTTSIFVNDNHEVVGYRNHEVVLLQSEAGAIVMNPPEEGFQIFCDGFHKDGAGRDDVAQIRCRVLWTNNDRSDGLLENS